MKSMRAPVALAMVICVLAGCGSQAAAPVQPTATAVPVASAGSPVQQAKAALSESQVRAFISELERASRADEFGAVMEMLAEDARGISSAPVGPMTVMSRADLMMNLVTRPPPGRVYAPTEIRSIDIAPDGSEATVTTTGGFTDTNGSTAAVTTEERTSVIRMVGDKPKIAQLTIRETGWTVDGKKVF
jgi:hypothetical protein